MWCILPSDAIIAVHSLPRSFVLPVPVQAVRKYTFIVFVVPLLLCAPPLVALCILPGALARIGVCYINILIIYVSLYTTHQQQPYVIRTTYVYYSAYIPKVILLIRKKFCKLGVWVCVCVCGEGSSRSIYVCDSVQCVDWCAGDVSRDANLSYVRSIYAVKCSARSFLSLSSSLFMH